MATLIMAVAARIHVADDRRAMPVAGAALMLAIALGSALGGLLVKLDTRAPFGAGAVLLLAVAGRCRREP